jgi:mannose-1-phosphate guanylyltransferase
MSMPGIQIRDGLWVGLNVQVDWSNGTEVQGPVYLGSGVRVAAGAKIIGPTWIGHGSDICARAEVRKSVLFDYTRVMEGTSLDGLIVFRDYCVDRMGSMKHVSETNETNRVWENARQQHQKYEKQGRGEL